MKKLVGVVALIAGIAAGANLAVSGPLPATGVFQSPHDINQKGQKDDLQRVCIFCHTPHNAEMGGEVAGTYPLWNHTLPDTTGWQNYVWATYANSTLDTSDPLMGPSRLCMSCHDGVTAYDQHGAAYPQAGTGPLVGNKAIGRNFDLTDDHPIGFSYDDAVTARNTTYSTELVTKDQQMATAIVASGTAGTYDTVTRTGKRKIQDVLFQGSVVTCASCHEVHNKDNAIVTPALSGARPNYFLWADEKDSLNCISCHIK
jgi:cytochrome c553